MVSGFPEIAQRYFFHAIAVGTPLHTTVRLEMQGTFLLGVMTISGSDAIVQGAGWTRFWINGLIPVVNLQNSPDLNRSALSRAAMEAMWAPASLLPANGVTWEQIGPDTARLTFSTGIEPVNMTLGAEGRVLEVVTMRWSGDNADKTFRLQPFGGTMESEQTFEGFTIPTVVKVGSLYGTADYLAFFQARVTAGNYL